MILDLNNHIRSLAIENSARLTRTQSGNEVEVFIKELLDGKISGLITVGLNPVYSLSEGEKIKKAIIKIEKVLLLKTKQIKKAIIMLVKVQLLKTKQIKKAIIMLVKVLLLKRIKIKNN